MSSSDQTPTDSSQTSCANSSSCTSCRKQGETLPVVSDVSAPKKQKIDDSSPNIEFIQEFLKCSVCLDFPSSPIHTCDNAHVLCGHCAPKLKACPTCKLTKLSPSPICEKLAKEAKIQCPNFNAGCKGGVLSTKIEEHLASCYFREITCRHGEDFGDCGVKIKFNEYIKHLKEAHKEEEIHIGPKLTESFFYDEEEHVKSGNVLHHWGHTVIKSKNQHFIVHAQVSKQSQLFYSWISVLGDKDLAAKYLCDVKFKDSKASDKLGSKWTLTVSAFHEKPSNESEAKLFGYSGGSAMGAVPMAALRNWADSAELDEDNLLPIDVTYEIKKA